MHCQDCRLIRRLCFDVGTDFEERLVDVPDVVPVRPGGAIPLNQPAGVTLNR
jgi:hypothetical protein